MRKRIRKTIVKLLRLNNTPPEVGLGVAIGVFIAILPLYGFHTLLVLLAALLVRRANKIAILIGTNISLPPTVPFITWAGYEIGRYLLGKNNFPPLAWSDFKHITIHKVISSYPPLFLGSVILGVICAVILYFIAFFVMKQIEKRKKRRLEERKRREAL